MKNIFVILFFVSMSLSAQQRGSSPCSKYYSEPEGIYCVIVGEKLPSLKISLAEFQNKFLLKIDTAGFRKNIYIKTIIDTNGIPLCAEILKGNGNKLDTLALNYVMDTKFNPGTIKTRKIISDINIPFYGNATKETSGMKRINGLWQMLSGEKNKL